MSHTRWYDDRGIWHSVETSKMLLAAHMSEEHGLSVRRINRRLRLTDLEVCEALRLFGGMRRND